MPRRVDLARELAEVGHRAIFGRDREVVADVVAEVGLRDLKKRRTPNRLDPEIFQVIELADDAPQVADAIPVRVGKERGWIW
jgi:hypothetical protein